MNAHTVPGAVRRALFRLGVRRAGYAADPVLAILRHAGHHDRDVGRSDDDYVARAAEELRTQQCEAEMVSVMIRTNLFRDDEPRYRESLVLSLREPTANSRVLARAARQGMRRLNRLDAR